MKKLVLIGLLAVASTMFVNAQSILTLDTTTNGVYLLSTNRANIKNVTISSDKLVTLYLYDSDTLAAPYYGTNYVTGAYPTRLSYPTNFVTSFVGQNGFTNFYTNTGLWTITITNAAATNAIVPAKFVVQPNTAVSYDTELLHVNGITVGANTNATLIISYNSGR